MRYRLPDKAPEETIKGLWIDFKNKLLTDEVIVSATVTASNAAVAQNIQHGDTRITWDASGGTSGEIVLFAVTATGSMGSIREAEAIMFIK